MQFLIYIDCRVVIILPLRRCSSNGTAYAVDQQKFYSDPSFHDVCAETLIQMISTPFFK